MTPDLLLCMILLYGTWYDILGMIYSSAAAYFVAIRSQFRMRRTYRKQKEGEAKREAERVRETKKEDRDKTRTAEEERNTATTHLSCTSLHGCVLLPLGVRASSVYERARCCGAYHTVPVGWPGVDVLLLSFPLRVLLLLLLPSGPLFG